MLKNKKIIFLGIILFALIMLPTIVNAAEYTDTAQNIKWSYDVDKSGNIINLKCDNVNEVRGKVTIPSTIEGKPVVSLYGYAGKGIFTNCIGLTEVVIPDSVTNIGEYTFHGCTGLKKVVMSKNITKIGRYAFYDCVGLTEIIIPSKVTNIEDMAFYRCKGITKVTIPNSVTTIGSAAFCECKGITKVIIPDSVTTIGSTAFANSGLQEITLSNRLTAINGATFKNTALVNVIIPNSVTSINNNYGYGSGAFDNCKNLQKILIPDTVVNIDEYTFQDCPNLTIYGNDNKASKTYAEKNSIKFDYIKNWDKTTGSDVTPPTVKGIEVQYNTSLKLDESSSMWMATVGTKLVIDVDFSEAITGSIVPVLTIKFGTGENIKITEGTISGSKITYVYTVKDTDKGIMSTVAYEGGNIKDASGNLAKLSCPKLGSEWHGIVYANGTVTGTNNTPNDSTNNNNGGAQGSGSTNQKPTTNNPTNKQPTSGGDTTKATGKLPQTGEGIIITMAVMLIIGAGIFYYIKYNKYKEI